LFLRERRSGEGWVHQKQLFRIIKNIAQNPTISTLHSQQAGEERNITAQALLLRKT
jgi:hypothetical protein